MSTITGRLVHFHKPKTGGTTMTTYLVDRYHGWPHRAGGGTPQHDPVSAFPPERAQGRVLFGTERDPWSWYYSWYLQSKASGISRGRIVEYGRGKDDFRSVLYGATHPGEVDIAERPGLIWGPWGPDSSFSDNVTGLYSWSFAKMYGDPPAIDAVVDMRQMYEGVGILLGEDPRPPTAVRNARHYDIPVTEVYDSDMLDWVAEADRSIIELMGYTGLCSPASAPVILVR